MIKQKNWYKLIRGLYSDHMHIFRLWQKHQYSFKNDQHKTVGGVLDTLRYMLSEDAELLIKHHEPQKGKYPSIFFKKARGQQTTY